MRIRLTNRRARRERRGAIVPLVALCLITFLGMIAIAIDLGIVALARNHCQSVADSSALAGVRRLNGDYTAGNNGNYDEVQGDADDAVSNNRVVNTTLQSGVNATLTTQIGYYIYNPGLRKFVADFTNTSRRRPTTPGNHNCGRASTTVNYTVPTMIAKVFAPNGFNIVTGRAVSA